VHLSVSSTEAISPVKFPVTVPLLYFPFIILQEVPVGVVQVLVETCMAKLLQLPMLTFMHCSMSMSMIGDTGCNKLCAGLEKGVRVGGGP
jgi:hypothetical protein